MTENRCDWQRAQKSIGIKFFEFFCLLEANLASLEFFGGCNIVTALHSRTTHAGHFASSRKIIFLWPRGHHCEHDSVHENCVFDILIATLSVVAFDRGQHARTSAGVHAMMLIPSSGVPSLVTFLPSTPLIA